MKIYVNMSIKCLISTSVSLAFIFYSCISYLSAQQKIYPVIKNFGGIYDIPDAKLKVEPADNYQIVIDLYSPSEDNSAINAALNNVARMINLHAIAGLPKDQLSVVLAIHGGATYASLNDDGYKAKYDVINPNTPLIRELADAGVF